MSTNTTNPLDDAHEAALALHCVQDFIAASQSDQLAPNATNLYCLLNILLSHLDAAHDGITRAAKSTVKAA